MYAVVCFKPVLNAILNSFSSQIERTAALVNCEATAIEWLEVIQWQNAKHSALAFIEGFLAHQNKSAIESQVKQAIVAHLMEQYDNGALTTLLTQDFVEKLTDCAVTFDKNLTTVTLFRGISLWETV